MNMNDAQRRAAAHRDGPCMVLSGPGSGKTTVITGRVKVLTEAYRIPPEHILVITFTRAAAAEMKKRYLKLVSKTATAVTFGTFHSVFFAMLRQELKIGPDAVAAEALRYRFLEEALQRTGNAALSGRETLSSILSEISYVKNHGSSPEAVHSAACGTAFPAILNAYEARLQEEGLLDYDDLLTKTKDLLLQRPEALSRFREQFQYLLIDEFQDVNPVQFDVVRLLAAPKNNLFIVGDDDQSIYAFRGAAPKIMLDFPKAFPGTKVHKLEVNYRSNAEIVRAAGALIGENRMRYPKKLTAAKGRGGSVRMTAYRTRDDEWEAIGAEIASLIQSGRAPESIAVLSRTNNASAGLVRVFFQKSIPFTLKDKPFNVFSHYVCKPVFAALNYASGNRTRKNFLLFMNCPYHGILREDLKEEQVDLAALEKACRADERTRYLAPRIRTFREELDLLARLKLPYAMVNYFRRGMGYDRFVEETAEKRGTDAGALLRILDDVQHSARQQCTVEEWYRFIAAYTEKLHQAEKQETREEGKVVLSTLHGAKGLEYETVYIPDLMEKMIPHEKARTKEALEEERRLLYVGMTRAVSELRLSYCHEQNGKFLTPSRFIPEIGLREVNGQGT